MSRYIPIAIIRIEHTYYDSFMNRNVILEPTSDTRKLMRQRGVMFVPTGTNEWQWAMPDDAPGFMDDDVLEVSMRVKDPYFLQQIESKGYEPGSFYLFSIENGVVEVNADYVWKKETEEQRLKNEFCRMKLEPVKSAPERLRRLHTKMEQLEKEGDGEETGNRLEDVKQEIRELQEICGPFINTMPLRLAVDKETHIIGNICAYLRMKTTCAEKSSACEPAVTKWLSGCRKSTRKKNWVPMSGELFLQSGSC